MALGLPDTPANFGGGGGSSSSSNKTTTTNADQRLNVSSGVGATASSGGSVQLNVTQLDGGAITQAFGMGEEALAGLQQFGTASMSASAHTAELAINGMLADSAGTQAAYQSATSAAIKAAQDAYSSAATAVANQANTTASDVAAAYQDAKTGNQRTVVIGGLIVAALAVTMPFLLKEAK